MRLRFTLILIVLASVPALADDTSQKGPNATYLIGRATVDITPDYQVRLNGFGFRRTESEGIRHRILVKALAIRRENDQPVLLITADTLCIPDSLASRVATRLKDKVGLPRERIAFTATHTHTAPMIRDVSPTIFSTPIPAEHQEHIDRYSGEFEAAVEKAAVTALTEQTPARLFHGVGNVGFAINRRTKGGPVDHELPVLVAKGTGGELLGVWAAYACHCVTLSDNKISGDWAGYAHALIEREHPGATAIVSIGCGADANPSSGVKSDKGDMAEAQGLEIASEVNRLLGGDLRPLGGEIGASLERIDLPLAELPSRAEWERRAKEQSPIGYHARVNLARLDRGETLTTKISYPVQSWTFGDQLALVFLPGEVVVDYSKRLKSELDGRRLWINAYANACPGYIPSERVLKEGGYEGGGAMVYYDIPAPYATGVEQKIIDAVRHQLDARFKSPDPK
jgi:neutral/alkaline ceramidase-like enzyme